MRIYGLAAGCYGLTINQNLQLSEDLAYKWVAGAAMNEVLRLRPTQTVNMLYRVTAADVARMAANTPTDSTCGFAMACSSTDMNSRLTRAWYSSSAACSLSASAGSPRRTPSSWRSFRSRRQ